MAWQDLQLTTAASDTLSATGKAGVEQYFQTQPILTVSLLSGPAKWRFRKHLGITTSGGSLLGGVLTACTIRIRTILGGTVTNGVLTGGTQIHDSGTFAVVGLMLNLTKAQIYLHGRMSLTQSGAPGFSSLDASENGQFLTGSGNPTIGITSPETDPPLTTLDCTVPNALITAVTFTNISGVNAITLQKMSVQYTG